MSEGQPQSVGDHPMRQELMARLTAVEEALRALEHEVRDVDRQPYPSFVRLVGRSAWSHRQPDERRFPGPVVEVAA